MVWVGLNLYPDAAFLRRTRRLRERADFVELSPETTWTSGAQPTPWRGRLLDEVRRLGKPVAGHGLFFGLGPAGNQARRAAWLEALAADHRDFDFAWFSEHLGFVESRGRLTTFALPLPPTTGAVELVANNLRELQSIVPGVAFEHGAGPYAFVAPESEPSFLHAISDATSASLLLDLHNVFTLAHNAHVNPDTFLGAVDLERVSVIHLAGGSESEPDWAPSGRRLRLDSHDGAVPAWCWSALERVVGRCPNLRGVVLERLPSSLNDEDVPAFEAEFDRVKAVVSAARSGPSALVGRPFGGALPVVGELDAMRTAALVDRMADAVLAPAAAAAWAGAAEGHPAGSPERAWLEAVDLDGVAVASLIVKKLRFQRLTSRDDVAQWFGRDPASFMASFRAYDAVCVPTSVFTEDELVSWDAFQRAG